LACLLPLFFRMSMPATRRPTVLVVDDEPLVCNALKFLLERFGFDAVLALSGAEALDRFQQQEFELVITDFAMPRMTGVDLASAIKAIAPHQRILLLTAYAERFWSEPVAAVDKILSKPISLPKLQEVIKMVTA
jgi:CheY-like chemotaxis protein